LPNQLKNIAMQPPLSNESINRLGKMTEGLSLEELYALNRIVVHRIKLFQKAGKFVALSKFAVGEKVSFFSNGGELITGQVIRLNQKTATIATDDDRQWNVSPELLRKGE
jgi:hypothetical protein